MIRQEERELPCYHSSEGGRMGNKRVANVFVVLIIFCMFFE